MALSTAPHPFGRPAPSDALPEDMAAVIEGSRGIPDTITVRTTVLADLHDEILALRSEQRTVAGELVAAAKAIEFAIRCDRPDVGMHVAGRLSTLATSLHRRGLA